MHPKSAARAAPPQADTGEGRPSEDHLQLIMDSVPMHISYVDRDIRYRFVSKAYQRTYDLPESEIVGRPMSEILGAAAYAESKPDVDRALAGEVVPIHRHLPNTASGPAHFIGSYIPDRGADGTVRGFLIVLQDITAEKRAGELLRSSEQRYRTLYETSYDGIGFFSLDGRITDANPALCTMLGYDLDELRGKTYRELTPARWHALDEAAYNDQLIPLGYVSEFEKEYIRRDGTTVPIALSVWLQRDDNGNPIGMMGIVRDITARKATETALRAKQAQLRTITDAFPALVAQVGPDQRYLFANQCYERWYGLPQHEVLGRTIREVIGEETYVPRQAYIREALAGKQVSFVSTQALPSGEERHVETVYFPCADKEKGAGGFFILALDVTERKRAEEELHRAEERFKFAVEGANQGLWDWDVNSGEVYYSPGWARMLGFEPGELPERIETWERLIHPEDRVRVLALTQEHLEGRTPLYSAEVRMMSKSGGWVWVLTRGRVVARDKAGNPLRATGTHSDITELKRVEAELEAATKLAEAAREQAEAANEALVVEMAERKRMQERLARRQKLEAVGELSGGIAHDFNNILMIVDGYTRRASERADEPELVRGALQQVSTATTKAVNLTKQLLAFSRRRVLETCVFRVDDAILEIEELLRRSVDERYELELNLGALETKTKTDISEFGQAIMNLTINARDAMPGGGRIVITSRVVEASEVKAADREALGAERYVELSVQDSGHGIPAGVLSRIFEPFFSTKEQGKGTGLGLAMVYGFSQQSGGAVDVESAIGRGTTFKIWLPAVDLPTSDDALAALDDAPRGKGELVLLVEDDEALLELTADTLRELGYEVLTAGNGFEALEVDETHDGAINLLLSDVVMPGLGGLEAAELMRSKRPDLKVVFMSGYPKGAMAEAGDLPKGAAFLQKPVAADRLARMLRQQLDHAA